MSGTIDDLEGDDVLANDDLYYLQDTRQVVGNCAILWRENSHGYTCDLNDAGRYTRAESERIVRSCEGEHVMLRCAEVDAIAVTHVRAEQLLGLRVRLENKP